MKGHLRLLNIACAAKAKWRQITLQKASRESQLHFSVQGGSERGFGVFVESVEEGSKAAEAGLKRGDQVRGRCAKKSDFKCFIAGFAGSSCLKVLKSYYVWFQV